MKFLFILCAFVLLSGFPVIVKAQDVLGTGEYTAGKTVTFDEKVAPTDDKQDIFDLNIPEDAEITVIEDKHANDYQISSVENLSKLYWKKNALDLNQDKAIDNYLLINECEIYKQFYSDDFEWLRIRQAGRDMLKHSKDSFSDKIKVIVPVDLGRYSHEKKGFPLINDTAFLDLRRIEIGGNLANEKICDTNYDLEFYPKNIILILSKPFTFDFVKLDEHVAQAYIVQQKYNPIKIPHELKDKKYERLAFARIRITFRAYQGETKGADGYMRAIMFGNLDGIDIFEDINETRLLTSFDF